MCRVEFFTVMSASCHYLLQRQGVKEDLLWPFISQIPAIYQLDILQRMARHFDGTYVSRMPLRPNIIVLQDTGGVEYPDKWAACHVECSRCVCHTIIYGRGTEVGIAVEVVIGVLDLLHQPLGCARGVRVPVLVKPKPEGLYSIGANSSESSS